MDERAYEDRRTTGVHKVYLNARKTAVMSGVRDVLSFDAKEVYLETEQGILLIRGDELHVNRLSLEKGEVDVDGKIDSLAYSDREKQRKSSRLLWEDVSVIALILGQVRFLLLSVCLGMALLFGYELLHIIRWIFTHKKMGDLGRRYFILVSCGYTGIYSLIYLQ